MSQIMQRCGVCYVPVSLHPDYKHVRRNNVFGIAYVFGRTVPLSQHESSLLALLMSTTPNGYVTRDDILDIWGDHGDVQYRAIDAVIKRLRRKLFPKNTKAARIFIETGYGWGYRIHNRQFANGTVSNPTKGAD